MESDRSIVKPPEYTLADIRWFARCILPYVYCDTCDYKELSDFARHPLTYEVLTIPIDQTPLYMVSPVYHVKCIAEYRLERGK